MTRDMSRLPLINMKWKQRVIVSTLTFTVCVLFIFQLDLFNNLSPTIGIGQDATDYQSRQEKHPANILLLRKDLSKSNYTSEEVEVPDFSKLVLKQAEPKRKYMVVSLNDSFFRDDDPVHKMAPKVSDSTNDMTLSAVDDFHKIRTSKKPNVEFTTIDEEEGLKRLHRKTKRRKGRTLGLFEDSEDEK